MIWIARFALITTVLQLTCSRTYKRRVSVNIFNEHNGGRLFEVQERSFVFEKGGSINVTVSCDVPVTSWDSSSSITGPFNVFLCDENPKTSWLYLYPTWGMCFQGEHLYHHCSIHSLIQTNPTTWKFNQSIDSATTLVARLRTCPIFSNIIDKKTSDLVLYNKVVVAQYRCEYTGIFLNQYSRLSEDETWNPFVFAVLTVFYGALVCKSIYEIVRFWKYRVICSFYVYVLVILKFCYVSAVFWYYKQLIFELDLSSGHEDNTFIMSIFLAGKFSAYYLSLFVMASGYGIYNTELCCDQRFYVGFGSGLFTVFLYLFVVEDSYLEVPLVVIVSSAYAAVLALIWAFHFKRVMMVRQEFHSLSDSVRSSHIVARNQMQNKEMLVGVAFAEIIAFLAFVIVFEFYHAENYPVPGINGVVVVELFDFILIWPLTITYNMRDLSRYYPKPRPPPLIYVIKTPDEGYRISTKDGDKLSLEEEKSDIQIIRLSVPENLPQMDVEESII